MRPTKHNGQIVGVFIGILIFIALVTIVIVFLFGKSSEPKVIIINESTNLSQYENITDEHGCKAGWGYSWCDIRQKCYRPWEEACSNETSIIEPINTTPITTYYNLSMNPNIGWNYTMITGNISSYNFTLCPGAIVKEVRCDCCPENSTICCMAYCFQCINTSSANASTPFVNSTKNDSEFVNAMINLTNQMINNSIGTYAYSNCTWNLPYPDRLCSPGKVLSNVTAAMVCTPGYATSVRDVSQSTKDKVYAMYGVVNHTVGQWEIDHIISLQLGGSNDIENLYPEPAIPYPGFHQKDLVENYLHKQVCDGKMDLATAQDQINNNWVAYIATASGTKIDNPVPPGEQIIG